MSNDRINVACPYCGEVYNLLASSAGGWWKCRNDQCRRGFEVEDTTGESPKNDNDSDEITVSAEANPETFTGGETASDGIISLEAYAVDDNESPSSKSAAPEDGSLGKFQADQEQALFQRDDLSDSSSPRHTEQNSGGLEELDAFIDDGSVTGKVPDDDGEETLNQSKTLENSELEELASHTEEKSTFSNSWNDTANPFTDQRDFSTNISSEKTKPQATSALTKKQKLQRKMKWVAAAVLLIGVGITVSIFIFRPQPNEITDWVDAVRLYEERKWSKAKRSFARYNDNFPESDHAQEIPFFIDMCKAGADIFSRTGNPDRGWKGIQKIYKNHRNNPAYKSYAPRFREAIAELKDTYVDMAGEINSEVELITPKDIIRLQSLESAVPSDQIFDQWIANIRSKRTELETAGELLGSATETLELLNEVSLANKSVENETAEISENLGKNIDVERSKSQYLNQRLVILERFANLLNIHAKFKPDQIDSLYDAINSGLDELNSGLQLTSLISQEGNAPESPTIERIEAWQKQCDELLHEAYRRESRRITYTPSRDRENFTKLVGLPNSVNADSKSTTNASQSLFIVRGKENGDNDSTNRGKVYFSISRGILYAFNAGGKFLWARRLGLDSYALPVAVPATVTAPQRVVAVSTNENKLLAINAMSGLIDWEYSVNLNQNLLSPLTVIRVPALVDNKEDHIVGLLPTANGQIHVLELNRGRTIGIYEVGHPLAGSGAWDPQTGYVFFAADAKRVFAINPAVIAENLADETQAMTPASPAVLYTNHLAGSLRGSPVILGSCLITTEISDLDKMKLRAFEINRPNNELDVFPEIKQPPLKEFTVNGLSWFEPARIPDRLAAITDDGQLGIFGINIDNISEAMYPLIENDEGGVHSVAALNNSRSMVVQSDEQFAWILADGQMQHLFLDIRNQRIKKIWPREGEESPVNGYPLHKAQSDDWSTTFFIASADLNNSETEFTAVDAATGKEIWHRTLGLKFFGDPRPLNDGSVALLDQSGALVKLKEQYFEPGSARSILALPPLGAKVENTSVAREDMELIKGHGEDLYLVGYAPSERSLHAKRVGSRTSKWVQTPLPYKPLGNFVIRNGKLVAACEDGLVHFCDFRDDRDPVRTQPFQWDSDSTIDENNDNAASIFIDPSSDDISDPLYLINGKTVRGLSVIENQGTVYFQQQGKVQLPDKARGAPIISPDGTIIISCINNSINWIDLNRNAVIHSEKIPVSFAADPIQCGEVICVALSDQSIMGLGTDHRNATRWQSDPFRGHLVGEPILLDGNILVTDLSGEINAINPVNGETVWQRPIKLKPGQIPSAAAVPIGEKHLLVPLIDGSFIQVKTPNQLDKKNNSPT